MSHSIPLVASPGTLGAMTLHVRVLRRGQRHLSGPQRRRAAGLHEDCAVCRRPNLITVTFDAGGDAQLEVTQEYQA